MAKRVVVIASGETERRAIPILMLHLLGQHTHIYDVRIPPRNKELSVDLAEKLIKAAWYANPEQPDKFVILIDLDGSDPVEKLLPFKNNLPERLGSEIQANVLYAYAQWHLEAWYFADAASLREYLGKALGSVDTSRPDDIQNPKLHLKNLLYDRIYTAGVSQEIARNLDAQTIAQRSPSFRGSLDAVMNGTTTPDPYSA